MIADLWTVAFASTLGPSAGGRGGEAASSSRCRCCGLSGWQRHGVRQRSSWQCACFGCTSGTGRAPFGWPTRCWRRPAFPGAEVARADRARALRPVRVERRRRRSPIVTLIGAGDQNHGARTCKQQQWLHDFCHHGTRMCIRVPYYLFSSLSIFFLNIYWA